MSNCVVGLRRIWAARRRCRAALAVLRLITSSYFVGACTGRSAGFSPLRMRSTVLEAKELGTSLEVNDHAVVPALLACGS
jgi:hypothetical protein